ncbi:putative membrane transporter protein MamO [Rhodovastum atsumiense]|nr:TSUP family transporter [Rhodovastum atsumiense]CAH2598642.1 putative membrane transporter protein MamO [Rhodovastum atsumiense]
MQHESVAEGENPIVFCQRPWRILGAAIVALMAVTVLCGVLVLGNYQDDDRFGDEHHLSVTDFMMRNVALTGSMSLIDAIAPAVVGIEGGRVNGGAVASGAIIGASGYVLTTLHAVEALREINVQVRTASGLHSMPAQIVKRAPTHDLVLLKIRSPDSFLYLSLANTTTGLGGQPVFVFGQGEQGTPVYRIGTMSALPTELSIDGVTIAHLRPTDAVTSWEQGGGPVINRDGALLGIALAVQEAGGAVRGYVVPADVIDAHFQDVVRFRMAGAAGMVPAASATPGPAVAVATAGAGQGPGVPDPAGRPALGGAAAWWLRAANQVAAERARAGGGKEGGPIAAGNIAAGNGPPGSGALAVAPGLLPSPDRAHALGTRIAGFALRDLLGLMLLAIVKGVIGGMMTMGGGVFLVAGMMMFFGYGLFLIRPVAYLTNIFVYGASTLKHDRNGLIMWDKVRSLAPWAMLGVVAGYFIGNAIGDRLVEVLLGMFATLIAIKGAHEAWSNSPDELLLSRQGAAQAAAPRPGAEEDDEPRERTSGLSGLGAGELAPSALLGLPMGVISGILGITGGVVEVPLQHYISKVPLKNAIANSAALVLCASLTGTILGFSHGVSTGLIDWAAPLTLALVLIPASFIGGIVGAHLTRLAPRRPLKAIFSALMLAVAVRMFIGGH